MQLGRRWQAGTPAPAGLPSTILASVDTIATEQPGSWFTLTYLEGRPVVTAEDGTVLHDGPPAHPADAEDADFW